MEVAYSPSITVRPDEDALANEFARIILYHSNEGPVFRYAPKGMMHAGWVIGIVKETPPLDKNYSQIISEVAEQVATKVYDAENSGHERTTPRKVLTEALKRDIEKALRDVVTVANGDAQIKKTMQGLFQ